MKKRYLSVLLSGLIFSLIGCATTVDVEVKRPAEIFLHGAETIAVLPFMYTNGKNDFSYKSYYSRTTREQQLILDNMHDKFEEEINNQTDMILINADSAMKAIDRGRDCPSDVYIVGAATNIVADVEKNETRKTSGEDVYVITEYKKIVEVNFKYQIVDSYTDEVIYTGNFNIKQESMTEDNITNLPKTYDLISTSVNSNARSVVMKLHPYTTTKTLKLLKDKSKNTEMEKARELAKNNLLKQSCESYKSVYERYGLFEAGYNAALLLEAQYKLYEALDLVEELVKNYSDKRAYSLLKDINYEIDQATKLKAQQVW